jgi:hypothetical protein
LAIPGDGGAQTAHFAGQSLVISDGARRDTVAGVIASQPIASIVHAVRRQGAEYFIVIGARTWSRGFSSERGQCGSGTESYIEWLRVSGRLIVQRAQALYQSCWDNRDGWAIGWHGHLFTIETEDLVEEPRRPDDPARWRQLKWTFDVEHPDAGFKEEHRTPSSSFSAVPMPRVTSRSFAPMPRAGRAYPEALILEEKKLEELEELEGAWSKSSRFLTKWSNGKMSSSR